MNGNVNDGVFLEKKKRASDHYCQQSEWAQTYTQANTMKGIDWPVGQQLTAENDSIGGTSKMRSSAFVRSCANAFSRH